MTIVEFDRKSPLIVVPVTIKYENKILKFDFAVDTGASISLIDMGVMSRMGYHKKNCIGTMQTITASKTETAYEFKIDNIYAIGLTKRNFNVIARSLPVGLGIDGLLGLNFFKNKELIIDFKLSEIRIK